MMENNMSKESVRRAHIKAEQDIMAIRLANRNSVKNTRQNHSFLSKTQVKKKDDFVKKQNPF